MSAETRECEELRALVTEMSGQAHDHELRCLWCGHRMYDPGGPWNHHTPECPVTRARRLGINVPPPQDEEPTP